MLGQLEIICLNLTAQYILEYDDFLEMIVTKWR